MDIVDRVGVSAIAPLTFTLVESWTAGLDLTGWVNDAGQVVTSAHGLTWEVSDASSGTWAALTKTWAVQGGSWCLGAVSESLSAQDEQWPLPDREIVLSRYEVAVAPPAAAAVGEPRQVVTYTLWVTNTGDCADTMAVVVSENAWPTFAPPEIGPLGPGLGVALAVTVTIPAGANDGDQDIATLTLISSGDGLSVGRSALTTTVVITHWTAYLPLVLRGRP